MLGAGARTPQQRLVIRDDNADAVVGDGDGPRRGAVNVLELRRPPQKKETD